MVIGGTMLAKAKVVDRAVEVWATTGTTLEVPSVPTKAAEEKGSANGTKISQRADHWLAMFSPIFQTLVSETSKARDKQEAPPGEGGPLGSLH
ncbi:hypothetical protein Tco_0275129 [Tanacetum coccineum]